MSDARLLVSLLDPADSDELLRMIHSVLRPVDAERIALVRPPEPGLALAALRISEMPLSIVTVPGRHHLGQGEHAEARIYIWCSDESRADAVQSQAGSVVVAPTLQDLAWELVRRLTGDLREVASDEPPIPPRRDEHASREPGPATIELKQSPPANAVEKPAAAAAPPSPLTRSGRLPVTPSWARVGASAQPGETAPARSVPLLAADQRAVHPSSDVARAARQTRPVLTPLAALAYHLSTRPVSPSPTGHGPQDVAGNAGRGQPRWSRVRDLMGRAGVSAHDRSAPDLSVLGQALFWAHSTVVTVGTPKGGPGKTTEAAALGVLGARAVEPHGGSAVLVDANLNNPDAWRQLAVPSDAITVREIVDALNRGALVPNGEFARDERLRVLPERRSGGAEYSAAEVGRLVEHLRLRHTLVIVDLPNTLPGLGEGSKEALVAHWLQHADVVVLPIDLGEASFIAAGEILDAIEEMTAASAGRMRMPGVVVPLLVPGDGRRALELPAVAELLDHLREAGAAVVEVPFTVDVQTASHRRRSIVGASPRADRAFAEVLGAVVAARRADGRGRVPIG